MAGLIKTVITDEGDEYLVLAFRPLELGDTYVYLREQSFGVDTWESETGTAYPAVILMALAPDRYPDPTSSLQPS